MADVLTWDPHLRLSWGGSLGVPAVEVWSNTIRLHYGGVLGVDAGYLPPADILQTMCDSVSGAISDWINDVSSVISTAVSLDWVKLNAILATGKQRDVNTVLHDYSPSPRGHYAATAPFHHTYALTLRTATKRGRAHAGRIFPPIAGPTGADTPIPYCSVNDATAMATSFARCLGSIEDRIDAVVNGSAFPAPSTVNKIHAVVASPGSAEKGTGPITLDITGVTCDRVADVQHRRSNRVLRSEIPLVAIPRA